MKTTPWQLGPAEKADYKHPEANMYGCSPCPKCGKRYRYPWQGTIQCDDCGYVAALEGS